IFRLGQRTGPGCGDHENWLVRRAGYSRKFFFFREPMPREPSFDGAVEAEASTGAEAVASSCAPEEPAGAAWSGETLSRNVAVGTKNRLPVTAVLKSRMRS